MIEKGRMREVRRNCSREEMDYNRIIDKPNKRRKRVNKNEVNENMSDQKDFLEWVDYSEGSFSN